MCGRCLLAAVAKAVIAVDSIVLYRPQESPANRRINESAGDAVGILPGLITENFAIRSR